LGADVCLAFPQTGSKNVGTNHCMGAAKRAGIPVVVNWSSPPAPAVWLPPELSFVTIDFETANSDKASVIQVGVTKVIGGEVVSTHTQPVMPKAEFRNFAWANRRVHKLDPSYIQGALPWGPRLEKI